MALNVEFNHQSKRVKVTPGTTMFQVLAEAKEHFRLDDSRQFQLLHRSKPIDLSIPFRLTGISNNASVELAELEGAAEVQQVRVCIQLRDGKRVQASFGSDTVIERILTFLKLLPASEQFSLGFLRREIDSQAFTTTTLKDLGILSGSAMFRVQAADAPAAPAIQSPAAPPQQPHVSFSPSTTAPSPPPAPQAEMPSRTLAPQVEDVEMNEAADETEVVMSSYDALQLLRDSNFDAVSRTAITTLMKIVANILSDPGPLDKKLLEVGMRLLNGEANDLNISPDTRPVVRENKADPNFDVFKTQITRVQMQPRGPSTTEVLVDALKTKQDQLVGHEKPPRNTTVALEGRRAGGQLDLAAAESELSERSDAQVLISSLKSRREEMEKTKNFRTQAMRELDELKRKKVFQTALIRVQFPDRAVMQASFHPNETIQDVMNHVTECLGDQYKGNKFYLYVTPPTQKLAATKTLAELNLIPAALSYLSWLEVPPQTDAAGVGFYFRSDLLMNENAESKESTDPLQKMEYPKPLHLGGNPPIAAKAEPPVEPKRQASSGAKAAKKPSWLKL
uniref:UBX domain-containing protein n=1 Tax=Phytophthora ramorum TaxID=164328 RepID=H3GCB5_PHYRM